MGQDLDKHQHKIAADTARPFPVSGEQISELVCLMEEQGRADGESHQRKSARFEAKEQRSVLTVWHPGGSMTAGECVMLDLSSGGAGFLYTGFVHRRSQCVVHLKDSEGNRMQIPAEVMWCRFLSRSVHAIGVRWTDPIDVRQFVSKRDWLEQMANSDQFANTELTGRLLTVGFDEIEIELLQSYLTDTSIQLDSVLDSGAARDLLTKEAFDYVMIDADNTAISPDVVLSFIINDGAQEPVIMVTNRADGLSGYESIGPATVMPRPYTSEVVIGAFQDLMLGQSNPLTGTRPILCELPPGKQAAVVGYIKRLQEYSENIEQYISMNAVEETVRMVNSIRNTASGFGFPILEQAADSAVQAVNASGSAEEAAGTLRILGRVIGRLQVVNTHAA